MGWPVKKLGDVCQFQNGFAFKSKLFTEAGVPILRISNIQDGSIDLKRIVYTTPDSYKEDLNKYRVVGGDLLIAMSGATTGKIGIIQAGLEFFLNQRVGKFIPKECIEKQYLYYYLSTKVEEHLEISVGAAQPNLSTEQIKGIEIPLPTIHEQKRVVTILELAFANIDKARANAEQNLKNARELFESYLQQVFSQRGDGWAETTIGEEVDLLTGFAFKSKEYVTHSDSVPLIRGDNIIQGKLRWDGIKLWANDKVSEYEKYQLAKDDIVLAMDRTWVKAGMKYSKITETDLPALLVQRVARLRCLDSFIPDYLYHLIGSKLFENYVLSIQTGLGVPHISGKQIQAFKFSKPNLEQQKLVVNTLNKLAGKVLHLDEIYQCKLLALDELKKSILQKAFTGELTKQTKKSNIIPFPVSIPDISTTDLHAGIIALAYQQHEYVGKEKQLGHVKAEKIAHMAEAMVGIDLDRQPVQDTAGPNDYPHFKRKVEPRAKKAGYFEFKGSQSNGYVLNKGSQFNKLIEKTRKTLSESGYLSDLENMLQIMVKMNTEKAEIFATVYAAWNNLLLDKAEINDETIVLAARENWHESKLTIPRERFFKAIKWIRSQSLEPVGRGKYVK